MRRPFLQAALVILGTMAVPSFASAAYLYFSSPPATVCQGSTFTLTMRLDSPSEAVNAGEIDLTFIPANLVVTGIDSSGSVFRFWAEGPEYDNGVGTIHMIGGLPTPGYQGTGALVSRLTMRATGNGDPNLMFASSTQILLDDGYGTATAVTWANPQFTVLPSSHPSCAAPSPAPTPGPTASPGIPGPTPTPFVCPEPVACSLDGEPGRVCDIIVECDSVPGRTIRSFVTEDGNGQCPIYTRCREDVELYGTQVLAGGSDFADSSRNLLFRPLKTLNAFTRGPQTGPFYIGIGLGALLLLLGYVLYRTVRRLRNRNRRPVHGSGKHIGEGSVQ